MPNKDDEKRRYFRIEDTVGVELEVLTSDEAESRAREMSRPGYYSPNRIQIVERELQLLIDKLRIQNPDFAKAIGLLNNKISIIKEETNDQLSQRRHRSNIKQASISACGISFESDERLGIGDKVYLDLTLLPTDLHIFTLGEVVGSTASELGHMLRVDFYGMQENDEELMVQHIVKRQGQLLAARKRNA